MIAKNPHQPLTRVLCNRGYRGLLIICTTIVLLWWVESSVSKIPYYTKHLNVSGQFYEVPHPFPESNFLKCSGLAFISLNPFSKIGIISPAFVTPISSGRQQAS